MALIIGVAASVLLALLIYAFTGDLLKNDPTISSREFILFGKPLQMLVSQPMYIFHQLAHWAMVYYARTHLKSSHELQPFHYWMAGMNLVFVWLHVAQSYLFLDNISYRLPLELPIIVLGLSYWFLTAKSSGRGLMFGYTFPYFQDIAEVAEASLPYYFSFVVLFSFWYKPFIDKFMLFLLRLAVELIFITHSCLIQTHVHENKYWNLLLELMVLSYLSIICIFPASTPRPTFEFILLSLFYAAVFAISQMHGLNFLTRMMKIVIAVLLIFLVILFDFRNPDFVFVVILALVAIYYFVLTAIMLVLKLIMEYIGPFIKKKYDDSYLHKKKYDDSYLHKKKYDDSYLHKKKYGDSYLHKKK